MVHSFLMIGQSNMAGRGNPADVEPIVGDNLKVLRNGRWIPMSAPVNYDRAFAGISLAESFAKAYADEHDVTVGLIPCADGGTRLEQWEKGGVLYDHAVMQAKLAQRSSTIVGVLWHQGESDSYNGLWTTYADRLRKVMDDLRADLDLQDVPVLLGGLGDYLGQHPTDESLRTHYKDVDEQLKIAAGENAMTAYVSAEGLTHKGDFLHFNSESLRTFGLRYYEAYKTLEKTDRVFEEKDMTGAAPLTHIETL